MATKKTKTSAKVPSVQRGAPPRRGRPPKATLPEPLAKDPVSKAIGTTLPSQTPAAEPALQKNLRQRPAASLQAPLRIFQIYYEGWQRELLAHAPNTRVLRQMLLQGVGVRVGVIVGVGVGN
jgi:hypothetical protein